MKRTEISILSWGIYLILLGFSFIIAPVTVVSLFGYSVQQDLWLRIVGILSAVLGMYYIQIAVHQIHVLYRWKLAGHLLGISCMLCFIFFKITDTRIVGTIIIELVAACWTAFALRKGKSI